MVLGLILANFADQAQVYFRTRGAVAARVAMGYQRATEVMLINRLGAAIYFLAVSIYVETSGTPDTLMGLITVALVFVVIGNLGMMHKLVQDFGLKDLARVVETEKPVLAASVVATLFGLAGLTLPYLAGIYIPAFRLTLSNAAFILNSIFTLLIVLVVDKRIAVYIDEENEALPSLAIAVIAFKTCAIALYALIFLFLNRQLINV